MIVDYGVGRQLPKEAEGCKRNSPEEFIVWGTANLDLKVLWEGCGWPVGQEM